MLFLLNCNRFYLKSLMYPFSCKFYHDDDDKSELSFSLYIQVFKNIYNHNKPISVHYDV